MKEKNIGYKLIKTEYLQQAIEIGMGANFGINSKRKNFTDCDSYRELGYIRCNNHWDSTIDALLDSGVLNIWFEPVYSNVPIESEDEITYGPIKIKKSTIKELLHIGLTSCVIDGCTIDEESIKYIKEYLQN